MTQQLAAVWAASIAEHPEDGHMLQKVFAADLDAARLPAPQPAAADNTTVNGPENTPGNAPRLEPASSTRPGICPAGCSTPRADVPEPNDLVVSAQRSARAKASPKGSVNFSV